MPLLVLTAARMLRLVAWQQTSPMQHLAPRCDCYDSFVWHLGREALEMRHFSGEVRGIPQLYNLLKGIIEAMQGMLWLLVLTTAAA